ncbi:MAG TPA: hypothetical protein VGT08_09205 [Terracidiphilus sp.]|nr:hypothetical protein [Terracidiphilus sp.]
MRKVSSFIAATVFSGIALVGLLSNLSAQEPGVGPNIASASELPDAPQPKAAAEETNPTGGAIPVSKQQPKRILGLMPNYRAVSAGAIPPPPTPKEAFMVATQNSFDYSSFVFVGMTSLIAEGEGTHTSLGKGVPGFWAYSWRGFVDKADGNYWVIFVLPSVLHEDERYFARGEGSILQRTVYSSTRVFITPDYHGHNTLNGAELLGRGIAEGIATSYYPSSDRSASALATKYAYAIMRDAATNTFREFWPDIAVHVLHRHP